MKYLLILALLITSDVIAQSKTLPSHELTGMDGKRVDISQLHADGKIIILDFWATWCIPCKKSLTNIAALYPEWQKKYNVELIAVSLDDARNVSKVKASVDGARWPYTVLLDPNQDTKRLLNFQNIPYTILLDQTGQIVYIHQGYVDGDEYLLEDHIKKIAAEKK